MVHLQAAHHLPGTLKLRIGFRSCVLVAASTLVSFRKIISSDLMFFGSLLLCWLLPFGENGDLLRQLSRAPTQPGLLCTGPTTPAGALSPMCVHLPSLSVASCLLTSCAVRAPALRFLCCSPSFLPIPTTLRQTVPRQPDFRRPALGLPLSTSSFQFFFWILQGGTFFFAFLCA